MTQGDDVRRAYSYLLPPVLAIMLVTAAGCSDGAYLSTRGAVLGSVPCALNNDCPDDNPCTLSTCLDGFCRSDWIPGCCWAPPDLHPQTELPWLDGAERQAFADTLCDDDTPCTPKDRCNQGTNTCEAGDWIDGCCRYDVECAPANPHLCQVYQCKNFQCRVTLKEGCCLMTWDDGYDSVTTSADVLCDDGDPCSNDVCNQNECLNFCTPGCCTEDTYCQQNFDDGDACTQEKCVFDPESECTYCRHFYQADCSQQLPYLEGFSGDVDFVDMGWSIEEIGPFPASNWHFGSAGNLGPDRHLRFLWFPTTEHVKSLAVTPIIDASSAASSGLNPLNVVTLQWRMAYTHWDQTEPAVLRVVASAVGNWADPLVLWEATVDDHLEYAFYSVELPGVVKFLETLQIAFMVEATSTFAMDSWTIDDLLLAEGKANDLALAKLFRCETQDCNVATSAELLEEVTDGIPDVTMEVYDHYRMVLCFSDPDTNDAIYGYWGRPHAYLEGFPMDQPDFVVPADVSGFGNSCFTNTAGVNAMCGNDVAEYFCTIDLDPKGLQTSLGTHHLGILVQDEWKPVTSTDRHSPLQSVYRTEVTVRPGKGYLIWSPTGASHLSAMAMKKAVEVSGRWAHIITDLDMVDDLSRYDGVLVTLGVKGYEHDLSAPEALRLKDYLDGGGRLYLEGGDFWFVGPGEGQILDLFPYFQVEGLWDGLWDGSPTLNQPLVGAGFLEGIGFEYDQGATFNFYNDAMAHKPLSGARELVHHGDSQGFALVVGNESASWRVIGSSVLFGGLQEKDEGTTDYLMNRYLYFFEYGLPPCALDSQCEDFEACTADQCLDGECHNDMMPGC